MNENRDKGTCPYCGVFVRFQNRLVSGVATEEGKQVGGVLAYLCPNCEGIVVVITRADKSWRRYPPPQPMSIPGAPDKVAAAFSEAQIALEAGAPRAAATMLRRSIASAATNLGVADRDADGRFIGLNKRIDGLKTRLLPVTYEAARATKLLGDAGAHEEAEDELGPLDDAPVRRAISVVSYVLSNLYEIPEKVKELTTGNQ